MVILPDTNHKNEASIQEQILLELEQMNRKVEQLEQRINYTEGLIELLMRDRERYPIPPPYDD